MISVDEARRIILDSLPAAKAESIPLADTLGLVLAEGVRAECDVPGFDNSAMDGYAVRAGDVAGANESQPKSLTVVGELIAGQEPTTAVGPGEAIAIMTGAPIPPGADTVAVQERTRRDGDTLEMLYDPGPHANVRRAGEDIAAGRLVFSAGRIVKPADMGVLASIGLASVPVVKQPRVAILATGNEIVDAGDAIRPGQVRNSNAYALAGAIREAHGVPHHLGIARDDADDLRARLELARECDVLLTCGGISVGKYDLVAPILESMGFVMSFHGVAMRPGKPFSYGLLGSMPVFALPGNPAACMVAFEQFARPAILRMSGRENWRRPEVDGILQETITKRPGVVHFVRVIARREGEGWTVSTTGPQGSGILTSMAMANALLAVPEDRSEVAAGETVRVQLLDSEEVA